MAEPETGSENPAPAGGEDTVAGGAAHPKPHTSQGSAFVLERELAEVYLLLDNISSSTDRSLPEINGEAEKALGKDWIERLSRIKWPPENRQSDPAEDAALVIRAKDFLNRQSHPATGATIAFTLLVTQEDQPEDTGLRGPGFWSWGRKPNTDAQLHRMRAEIDTLKAKSAGGSFDRHAASRTSLACQAYPGLVRKSAQFRSSITWISYGLVLWLLLTCALSWYTAFGNATLTQLNNVSATLEAARKRVSDAEAAEQPAAAGPKTPGEGGTAGTAAPGGATTKPVVPLCERSHTLAPLIAADGAKIVQYGSVAEMQACQALNRAEEEAERVRTSLNRWLRAGLPGPAPCRERGTCQETSTTQPKPPAKPQAPAARDAKPADGAAPARDGLAQSESALEDAAPPKSADPAARPAGGAEAAHASAVAAILSAAILPVFYGILGAGAAVVRSLSRKMERSLLAPRDLTLSIQRLALGAVVGACIGLFVASPGQGAQNNPGLLGTVALSGSALSFIAGFSVEAVFAALEALIRRIFNSEPTVPPAAPPPRPRPVEPA